MEVRGALREQSIYSYNREWSIYTELVWLWSTTATVTVGYVQAGSQGLSSLPPLIVGTETLVAAGHVTTQNLGGRKICWKGEVFYRPLDQMYLSTHPPCGFGWIDGHLTSRNHQVIWWRHEKASAKNFNAVSHNRARSEVLFSNLKHGGPWRYKESVHLYVSCCCKTCGSFQTDNAGVLELTERRRHFPSLGETFGVPKIVKKTHRKDTEQKGKQ